MTASLSEFRTWVGAGPKCFQVLGLSVGSPCVCVECLIGKQKETNSLLSLIDGTPQTDEDTALLFERRNLHMLPSCRPSGLVASIFIFRLVVVPAAHVLTDRVELRRCPGIHLVSGRHLAQPAQRPELRIQWDSWEASQLTASVAAIILQERLGFTIKLELGRSSKQMYAALSTGDLHVAFQAWPSSNSDAFREHVTSSGAVLALPYSALVGRSGVFETCDRNPDSQLSKCQTGLTGGTPLMLREALRTPEGQRHFQPSQPFYADEWIPPHCDGQVNCSTRILHIGRQDYDEGRVERMVEELKLPVTVAYLGKRNHTDALWEAYTNRAGALVYRCVLCVV